MSSKKPKLLVGAKATELALKTLRKAYGVDAGILMSEVARACDTSIETGVSAFDYGLLGIGGIPSGQFIQIYGKEGVGKTTLLLTIIAAMQQNGRVVFVIDPKAAVASDVARARRIGIDPDNVIILPVDTTQDALAKTRSMILRLKEKNVKMAFFWDDLGLAPTKSKLDLKKDGTEVAEKARSVWDFCQTLSGVCYKADIPMVIVNQLISVINTGWSRGGPTDTTSGGGGVKYASRINIGLGRGALIKKGKDASGHTVYATTGKNAFFASNRKVQLHLDYRYGFLDRESTLMNAVGTITKSRKGEGYKCDDIGVTEYKQFDQWTSKEILDLESLMWPWMDDPEGYDWSSMVTNTLEDEEDELVNELFS